MVNIIEFRGKKSQILPAQAISLPPHFLFSGYAMFSPLKWGAHGIACALVVELAKISISEAESTALKTALILPTPTE